MKYYILSSEVNESIMRSYECKENVTISDVRDWLSERLTV